MCALFSACGLMQDKKNISYAPVPVVAPSPPPYANGSIYRAGFGVSLFADNRARQVGDILTVIVTEKTDAQKKAETSTKRETTADVANPTILGGVLGFRSPLSLPATANQLTLENNLSSTNNFSGEGDSSQSNSLTGRITVTVAEVLPNGNMVIRGEKLVTLNQGDEYIRFAGVVRPADVQRDNTILSTLVADARITYIGEGQLADANSMGWLARFLNSKWWPF